MIATATATDSLIDRVIADLSRTNPQAAANLEFDLANGEPVAAQTFTVIARGESITFTSTLSDAKVLETLRGLRSSFAQDLARKFNKLSPAQYAWAHKLAVDANTPAVVDNNQPSQFEALFNAFEAAKSKGAKRLTLRFEGINIKPNRDLTALWVTSQTESEEGDYGLKPKYLGKVTRTSIDSKFSDTVRETVLVAASDPISAAIRYGKVSGSCSCCGKELTVKESIDRGIGPICARKFNW
jgi:hypothetical protein